MNSFIFIICLSFIFFLPGTMSYNDSAQEVVLTNGSTLTFLPCYIPGAQQIVWEFKSVSGDNKTKICTMDNGNKECNSTQFPNIKLADRDGFFAHGNYSLHFEATNTDAGIYYCTNGSTDGHGKEFRLISFNVSATPENVIHQGDPVKLMLESSDVSYFRKRASNISTNPVKGEGIEIHWSRNSQRIIESSRFQFDYRSLNISAFRSEDEGRYVYTVKLSNGKQAFYSISLQIAGQNSTTATPGERTNTGQNSTTATPGERTNSDHSGATEPGEGSSSDADTHQTTEFPLNTSSGVSAGAWIASSFFGTLGIMIIIIILVSIIIKKKFKSAGEPDTVQATMMDNEVPYAQINLAALTKAEPSAPVTTENVLYAEVKTLQSEPATNEISV
ncbi:uncharacterized protein LOC132393381 [Hypanus sabinus]|uniref:uncharacterized protein LOC132393381 n=1 Tax=Hypanus sabinus TaxID=79690 RepID=UPI0028C447CF|nr:uncharacterized protein LOC132393381 [Hypanus sabinus]